MPEAEQNGHHLMQTPSWTGIRNGVLFFTGVGGIIYEMAFASPIQLGVFPFLVGLIVSPPLLRKDEAARLPGQPPPP